MLNIHTLLSSLIRFLNVKAFSKYVSWSKQIFKTTSKRWLLTYIWAREGVFPWFYHYLELKNRCLLCLIYNSTQYLLYLLNKKNASATPPPTRSKYNLIEGINIHDISTFNLQKYIILSYNMQWHGLLQKVDVSPIRALHLWPKVKFELNHRVCL